MKGISRIVMILLFTAPVFPAGSQNFLSSKTVYRPGDIVFARWRINAWFHGRIEKKCKLGWFIKFDDGDEKCCAAVYIVKDRIPSSVNLKVGTAVLARWTSGQYFPGIIAAVSESGYLIKFDDGDEISVSIDFIRKR